PPRSRVFPYTTLCRSCVFRVCVFRVCVFRVCVFRVCVSCVCFVCVCVCIYCTSCFFHTHKEHICSCVFQQSAFDVYLKPCDGSTDELLLAHFQGYKQDLPLTEQVTYAA